jgi:hypothetical protein
VNFAFSLPLGPVVVGRSCLEDTGKMDIQFEANAENQDRAKRGKNETGGMKSSGYRVRKHVGNRAADDRSD